MNDDLGRVSALYRFPIKSMGGEPLSEAAVSWHGLAGDRRFAFVRSGEKTPFPWLTAGRMPALIAYCATGNPNAPRVRTPDGKDYDVFDPELAELLSNTFGKPVHAMQSKNGVFDEAPVSLMTEQSVNTLAAIAGQATLDARRFRQNIVIAGAGPGFPENDWVGHVIAIGEVRLHIALRDVRCAMINIDPDNAVADPRILKALSGANAACLGVYAYVEQPGTIRVGDAVRRVR